jgi:Tfp pilus assembly protein PilF
LTERAGDRIGRYKLLEQIGEGGCGVVYVAEQDQPVRRRVALKVIKLGMDTRQVIARFEAERQALALMDHPNIAKVLDGGATETGRPFFVMELVKGVPITRYCDENRLSTQDRLKLFIQVCQAIQHAHQKGIIHRDIKPSNILVADHDGVGAPKVIDFGIAKATTDQPLTDKTLYTAIEQFIGTPAYMSPEQAKLSGLDIDTRSDIYSLGVLLYELLTGRTPFDVRRLIDGGLDEIRRIIREEEPPRPSTRLSTLEAAEQTTIARCRQSEPPKLVHLVRGDLDWIVMKTLEKDRNRRYETANGLAMDLRRFLEGEPIFARPPSGLYRCRKLVQRNKLVFAAAGAVAVALLLGLSSSTWLLIRERAAHRRSVAAELAQGQLRRRAEAEAAKSGQIAQFLKDMLRGVGPSRAKGRDTAMLREILDQTAKRVATTLTNDLAVQAELLDVVGRVYTQLGDYREAEIRLRQALEARERLGNGETPDFAASLHDLADALRYAGKLKEAEAAQLQALALERKLFGPEHAEVASSLNNLALILRAEGKLGEAESSFREVLAMQRRLFGEEHEKIATVLNNLAGTLGAQNRFVEAETTFRQALAMRRKLLGPEHGDVASSLNDLATVLSSQDRLTEAADLLVEALAMRKKLLGDNHSEVAATLVNLATVRSRQERPAEAEKALREALAIQKKTFGADSWRLAYALNNLGSLLHTERKLEEAGEAYKEAARVLNRQFTNGHPILAVVLTSHAAVLSDQANFEEAEQLARQALTVQTKLSGKEHLYTANSLATLSRILTEEGKLPEAQATCEEALQIHRKLLPPDHADIADLLNNLAIIRQEQGDLRGAEAAGREALAMRQRLQGEDSEEVLACLANLSGVLSDEGKHDEAESMCRQAIERIQKSSGSGSPHLVSMLGTLGRIQVNQGRTAEAEATYREVVSRRRQQPGANEVEIASSLHNLADVLVEQGKLAEAETTERDVLATLRKRCGETHPNVAEALGLLAGICLARNDLEQAASLAAQNLLLAERARPDAWSTFAARGSLGAIRLRQQKYAEAEALLLSAYNGLRERERRIPPSGKSKLRGAAQSLADLYEAQAKPDQAAEWKRTAAATAALPTSESKSAKDHL